MIRTVPIAIVFLLALLVDAEAEEKDILRRMMAEPVTLFDWGMAQLDRDIARAAQRTLPVRIGASARPVTGAIYDWHTNMVTLYVSAALPPARRTAEFCTATFKDIVTELTALAPQGPNAAGWYLTNAFKPKGHSWSDRFEDVRTKLLETVRLEVSFIPATYEALRGDDKRVRCVGRLDAEPNELTFESTS